MLETLDHETFPGSDIDLWVGNGALTLVKRALSADRVVDESLDPVLVEKALKIFLDFYADNLCRETKPYANVTSTLNALKAEGYRMAIVTNKPHAFVQPILEGLNLDGMFELILGGDSLEKKKPDPLPLLHVSESLNIPVENCLMVGDSKNDILAASACGMQSIAVSYGYNYGEDIGIYEPDIIIDHFAELIEIV
jgi:phosphoglycolate phosphatase